MPNCDSCGGFMDKTNSVALRHGLVDGSKEVIESMDYYECGECELEGRVHNADSQTYYGACVEPEEED